MPALSLCIRDNAKNLLPPDGTLDHTLGISQHVAAIGFDFMDPVQNKLTVVPLVKSDHAGAQLPAGLLKPDLIPLVDQEGDMLLPEITTLTRCPSSTSWRRTEMYSFVGMVFISFHTPPSFWRYHTTICHACKPFSFRKITGNHSAPLLY